MSFEKLNLTHVFRSCCSGIDPTMPQWEKIAEVCKKKNHFPLFDLAYLGKSMGLTTLKRSKSTSSRERFMYFLAIYKISARVTGGGGGGGGPTTKKIMPPGKT